MLKPFVKNHDNNMFFVFVFHIIYLSLVKCSKQKQPFNMIRGNIWFKIYYVYVVFEWLHFESFKMYSFLNWKHTRPLEIPFSMTAATVVAAVACIPKWEQDQDKVNQTIATYTTFSMFHIYRTSKETTDYTFILNIDGIGKRLNAYRKQI